MKQHGINPCTKFTKVTSYTLIEPAKWKDQQWPELEYWTVISLGLLGCYDLRFLTDQKAQEAHAQLHLDQSV